MDVAELLTELYERIPPLAEQAATGLDAAQLAQAPQPGANSIGWLVWHIARVHDSHISEVIGESQLWSDGNWASSFGLDDDPGNTGYGHSPSEAAAVQPVSAEALLGYLAAVTERTRATLAELVPDDLDRTVDESYDPPVTLGVRLVSIADDCLQHAGQAAYARGLFGY